MSPGRDDALRKRLVAQDTSDRVFVVGAGGIGCALGHALRAGGVEVVFVDADADKVRWGDRHGVGVEGRPRLPAGFVTFEDWQPPERGRVLLCTKCYDNAAVLARLAPSVDVIPVQNGFDRSLTKRIRLEGIASFVSECVPGRTETRITRRGELHIGWSGSKDATRLPEAVEPLVAVLERHGAFSVRRVPNVLPYKYSKLMYNAAISPIAAAAGLDNGQLLTLPKARRLFFGLLRENLGILRAAGVPLGKVGPVGPEAVDRVLHWPLVARVLALPFSLTLRNTYCSMAGDIPKGRTEIENFNGHLIELAEGRPCPLNRSVHALVKRMQAERVQPALCRLDELVATR